MLRTMDHSVLHRTLVSWSLAGAMLVGPVFAQAPQPLTPDSRSSVKVPATSEVGTHELTRTDLEAFLDGFVPFALKNADIAGMTIAVVKDGQVLLEKGYGYADVKTKRAMDPDLSMIRAGSTSKLFTWTSVMQLVEEGKIDLDRNIEDYLDFKIKTPFQKPITMRNLMTHRAGFQEGLKSVLMVDQKQYMTTEQFLKTNQPRVIYPPGEVPAYSNYGAALAGYIVQRVSGEPFESYVEHHIFEPLGMAHSTFRQPVPEALRNDLAEGYMTDLEPPHPFELVITAPAGSLSTTADDMSRFMIAYLQGGQYQQNRILKPETVQQMFQPAVPQIDDLNVMGLGFIEENRNGRQIRGHGGDTIVFHTDMDLFVNEGVGLFFSMNSRGKEDAVYGIRQGLFDAFTDRYFPRQQPAAASSGSGDASHAQRIAGRYESSRRIEGAFLSVLYLLNQTVITANPDGSINVPTFPTGRAKKYREIGPMLWAEDGGQNKVALVGQGSSRTIYSNDDPTSVLQPVPGWKSAGWNLLLLGFSVAILVLVVVLWPVSLLLRRMYAQPVTASPKDRLVNRVLRLAALVDVLYLVGWIYALAPVLSNHLEAYNNSFDAYLRVLQVAGLLVIAAAIAGVWAAIHRGARWTATTWHVLTACALVAIVWTAFITHLIGFNLNY